MERKQTIYGVMPNFFKTLKWYFIDFVIVGRKAMQFLLAYR